MTAHARSVTSPVVRNPALLPGSLLRERTLWQQAADSCPAGAVLIVLPVEAGPQRTALESTALHLRANGHQVMTYEATLRPGRAAIQGQLPLAF
jgi:hypothetical protein